MKKADKNDVDFREMKRQFENDCLDLAKQIRKFIKERELLHLYIKRLEQENLLLAGRTNQDETVRLLTYSSQTPNSFQVNQMNKFKHLFIFGFFFAGMFRFNSTFTRTNYRTN